MTARQRDPETFAPVFVLSPARSNSTVAVAMIGRHPQLYGFPELALFRRGTVGELMTDPPDWRGAPAHRRMAGLLRAIAELHDGEQTDASIAAALTWLQDRLEWRSADVYDHLLDACAPRIGVEKSPEHAGGDAPLARVAAAYPRARYIHLTRHPVPAVQSMYREWHTLGYWTIEPQLFHHFCLGIWYFQHARIDRFIAQRDAERVLLVRSEDLVNSPAAAAAAHLRMAARRRLRRRDRRDVPPRGVALRPARAVTGARRRRQRLPARSRPAPDAAARHARRPRRLARRPVAARSGARARRTDGLWPLTPRFLSQITDAAKLAGELGLDVCQNG